MDTVQFTLSGYVYSQVEDGGWPQDNPRGWAALEASPSRRVGKGFQCQVTMLRDDAWDLAYYIESVADVWACMTTEERGNDRPAPLRIAVERIRKALRPEAS